MEKTLLRKSKENLTVFYGNYKKIIAVCLLILLLFVLGQVLVGNFMSTSQLLLTIKMSSFIAFFGLCQMAVISVGGNGLDLSVGYTATLTAVLTASVMDGKNANLPQALLMALGIGILVGLTNGLLIAYVKLPPLVVTLAMSSILQGIINVYTAGKNITGKPSPVLQLIAAKSTGIVPNVLFLLILVALIVTLILNKTKFGLIVYGVGSNERTAYLSGINVRVVRCAAYIICSTLASLIGLLLIGNMGTAFKDMGSNYVMPSVAAVVVGGVSMKGGEGNYLAVILGAVFLQTLTNLLVALGWGDAGTWLGFGLVLYILLMAYVSDRRRR